VVGRLRGDLLRVRWRCEGGSPVATCQRARRMGAERGDGRVGVVDAMARVLCCVAVRGAASCLAASGTTVHNTAPHLALVPDDECGKAPLHSPSDSAATPGRLHLTLLSA
jgi:hypothetical protein